MSAPSREVRLAELTTALFLATDLGMGQPLEQALRYCLLAPKLGRRVGCDARALSDVYYLALLEHLGCTATAAEMAAWNGGNELAFRSRAITLTHASTGESMRHLARYVGQGLPRAQRARLLTAFLAAGEKREKWLVAVQCEGAARLAARLGMTEGGERVWATSTSAGTARARREPWRASTSRWLNASSSSRMTPSQFPV